MRAANLHILPSRDEGWAGLGTEAERQAMTDSGHNVAKERAPAARSWPARVRIVAPTPDIVGGQSVQAASLVARLERVPGLDVRLVPINPAPWRPLRFLRRVKYVRTVATQLRYIPSLFRELRRADIVHVFSASYLSFVLAPTPALLIAKLYGKRTILHYHSGEAEDHLRRWRRTAISTLGLADRILVPSEYLVKVFAKFGLEAEAIPNFVRRDRIGFRPRPTPAPILLSNRNLAPLYNVSCILRAFSRVQARYPDASLTVAGDGPQRRRLQREAKSLGLRNVSFVGQVHPARMPELYDAADVYINASDVDNMPLSILESFAAGLPVVSTKAGGIPFFTHDGENAILVERGDEAALAEGVFRLLEEPGLSERLTTRARADFERSFSWQAVGDRWLDLYAQLMSPLRICIVAPTTRILGGQAVQAARLLRELRGSEGVSVTLLPVNPRLSRPLRWLQRIKYVRTAVTEVRYVWNLWFGLRRADVAHIFSASYLSFLLAPTPAILMARLLGRRTILNYRSGEADDHLRRWRRTAIPTLRSADRIIVGSPYLIEIFARHGLQADAIPNIVEVDRYTYRERPTPRPVFLSNRNFEPHYNVGDVLRAFAIVAAEYPDARLIVAGDGPQRPMLEELTQELGITGIEWRGPVPPDRMPGLYDEADIYLNASVIDNMPTSLIEAFAAGTPVVTSATGGIPWIVDHDRTGLMVPPKDYKALADAALRVLREEGLALRLARAAREACVRLYTWRVVRDQWLEAYRGLGLGGLAAVEGGASAVPAAQDTASEIVRSAASP